MIKTLYKKEVQFYFNNPIGYIVIALFAATINFLFIKDIFIVGIASMKQFFSFLPWVLLFFIPALSMRIFSEEKRINTMEVLLTLPVTETQIVISKFLALFSLVAVSLILTAALPIYLILSTQIHIPEILVGYFGVLLFSSFFLAISLFYSLKTKNQIVSFLISLITLFIFLGISSDLFSGTIPKILQDILIFFSPLSYLQNFIKGILDLRSILFFVNGTILLLVLTVLDLEKRD